jgi:hypothetical protein
MSADRSRIAIGAGSTQFIGPPDYNIVELSAHVVRIYDLGLAETTWIMVREKNGKEAYVCQQLVSLPCLHMGVELPLVQGQLRVLMVPIWDMSASLRPEKKPSTLMESHQVVMYLARPLPCWQMGVELPLVHHL